MPKPEFKESYKPTHPTPDITISEAKKEDIKDDVLTLFDDAVSWLVSQGNVGQWGTEKLSTSERFQNLLNDTFNNSLILEARHSDGTLLGIMGLSPQQPHPGFIPAAPVPELYITVLCRNRATLEVSQKSKGVGGHLVSEAKRIAKENGVELVRVDCYGGGAGRLVHVYEGYGFKRNPEEPLRMKRHGKDDWPMQVLEYWLKWGEGISSIQQ